MPLFFLSATGRIVDEGVPIDGVAVFTCLGLNLDSAVRATGVGVIAAAAIEVLLAAAILLRGTRQASLGLIRSWIALIALGAVFMPEVILLGPGGHLTERAPMAASIASLGVVLLLTIFASGEAALLAAKRHHQRRAALPVVTAMAFFCGGCGESVDQRASTPLVMLGVETPGGTIESIEGYRGDNVSALNGRPEGFVVRLPSTSVRRDGHGESLRALCPGVPVLDTEARFLGSVAHWAEGPENHLVLVLPHADVMKRYRILALSATDVSDWKRVGLADVETEAGQGVKVCTVWGDAVFGVEAMIAVKDGSRVLLASDAGSAPLSAIYGSGPCAYALLRAPPVAVVRSLPDTRIVRGNGPLVGTVVGGGGTWMLADLGVEPRCLRVTMGVDGGAGRKQEWRFSVALRPGNWFGTWLKQAIGHLLASSNFVGRSADLKLRLDENEWSEQRVEAVGKSLARSVAEAVLSSVGPNAGLLEGRTLSVAVTRR